LKHENPYAAASLAAILAGCAASNVGTDPVVPDNLKVPAGQTLSLVSRATGVQIYECSGGKTDPAKFEWAFKAPEADLFDLSGRKIGKHYAGPTWESDDGSKVGRRSQSARRRPGRQRNPVAVVERKIDFGGGGLRPDEKRPAAAHCRRKAPAEACDRAQLGRQARVAYRATYYFYIDRP